MGFSAGLVSNGFIVGLRVGFRVGLVFYGFRMGLRVGFSAGILDRPVVFRG